MIKIAVLGITGILLALFLKETRPVFAVLISMAAFLKPLSNFLCSKKCSFLLRGFLYMLFIFTAEYMSGSLLKKHHCCPWDYSGTHFQINGVIRLDYAPLWFFCGLLFEYLNQKNGSTSS